MLSIQRNYLSRTQQVRHLFLLLAAIVILPRCSSNNSTNNLDKNENSISPKKEKKDCSDVYIKAGNAYDYSNKVYLLSSSLEQARDNAMQAKNAFNDTKTAASNCGCDEAYRYANNGYGYANNAYTATNLQNAKFYGMEAEDEANKAKTAAQNCGNK